MKKIISIAFAAILAGFAISCQKEDLASEKTENVQYTFNITVNGQFGFDNDSPTKGGASGPAYKTAWADGDRIFLFFKPTSGSLLTDTYATLTYNGSTWGGGVTGMSSLGEGGTLSAVYVYNLGSGVTPAFSGSKWTIAAGNVFYNFQTGVDYTVSGNNEISASITLEAPADFVRFTISGPSDGTSEDPLTCDKVKGWDDVVIGSDMTFSNATCTGYMTGNVNVGDSMYKDYFGRIVSGRSSLKGVKCNFSIAVGGKVYERSTTPSSDARSFKMTISTSGEKAWKEASEKLPGLFTIGKGADGTEGTADDVKVRFSKGNLWYGPKTTGASATFNFETNQYDISSSWNSSHVSNFYWSKTDSRAYSLEYSDAGSSVADVLFTNATETTPKSDFTVNGITNVWRALSRAEWQYLLANHSYKYVSVNGRYGIIIAPDGYSGTIEASSYEGSAWTEAEAAGFVFLPSTGFRENQQISEINPSTSNKISCIYWTSTAVPGSHNQTKAYRMFFQYVIRESKLYTDFNTDGLRSWAVGIRLVSDL